MAQAPNRGLKFIVEDRNIVFGTLNNGDTDVIVLAVETAKGTSDYKWEIQVDIDYLKARYGENINEAMDEVLDQTNKALERLFGKAGTPDTAIEKYQAYIMDNLEYDSANNKIERKG
jgi:hypothetical protein